MLSGPPMVNTLYALGEPAKGAEKGIYKKKCGGAED